MIEWVESLKRELEMPESIRDAGIDETDFMAKFRASLLDSFQGRPFVELANRIESESISAPAKPAQSESGRTMGVMA